MDGSHSSNIILIQPATPQSPVQLSSCFKPFCYHCVEYTVNNLVNHVEQKLNSTSAAKVQNNNNNKFSTLTLNLKQKSRPLQKLDLFAPSHRRCRSDDTLAQGSNRLSLNYFPNFNNVQQQQQNSFISVSKLNGGKFMEENIKQSLQQAEELKQFIAKREYETNVELEKENAHFLLSELLISTIEQMKWRNILFSSGSVPFYSRQLYVVPQRPLRNAPRFSSTTLSSSSTLNDDRGSCSENLYSTSDELNRTVGDYANSLGDSFSETKPQSSDSQQSDETVDAGYCTSVPASNNVVDDNSAELVAMNLLQNFSKKHFPQVNNNNNNNAQCLVSYKDAPQLLLPMPSSTAVAPDDLYVEGFSSKVNIRGTFDWAPPRPQLIFNLNTPQKLKVLLQNQGNRCPGCGRKIDPSYYKRLRYCAYLGKAFCQCCHRGETALVPAHILHRWNFKHYPVSDFADRFLSSTYESPYYNVAVINKQLYSNVKALKSARDKRKQFIFTYDYIRTCREAKNVVTKDGNLLDLFERLPAHYAIDENVYSIKDFVLINEGAFERLLETAVKWSRFHIAACEWCSAKGFYCELCLSKEILFPFQIDFVRRCDECGSCFHKKCVKKKKFECPKCRRIKLRKYNDKKLYLIKI